MELDLRATLRVDDLNVLHAGTGTLAGYGQRLEL